MMKKNALKNMPDYSIRVYQLNYYIKENFPELSIHFKKNQINPDIFFTKWILTIFSNYLPFNSIILIANPLFEIPPEVCS